MKRVYTTVGIALALAALGSCWTSPSMAGPPTGALQGFAAKRTWADRTGKFKIEAQLVDATAERVQLKKTDGKVVTVPVNQLSEADHVFVNAFLGAEKAIGGGSPVNPFEGGEMVADVPAASGPSTAPAAIPTPAAGSEPAAGGSAGSLFDLPTREAAVQRVAPISVDTSGAFWKAGPVAPLKVAPSQEVSIQLPIKKEFFASLQMRVSGAVPNFLVGVYRQGRKPEENYSVLGRMVLPNGDPEPLGHGGEPWKLMAYSPDARFAAAVRVVGFDKGNDVALFELTENGAQPLYQFTAGGGSWDELHWIGFLGNNRLATISQKHTLTIWDLSGPRATSRGTVDGALSATVGGRAELLAIPTKRGVVVFECENFKQVGFVPTETGGAAPKIAFSPDGQRLAAYQPFEVNVYSLKDGQQEKSISVSESDANLALEWIGDNLLLGNKLLIDVGRGLPAWSYESRAAGHAVYNGQLYTLFADDKKATLVSLQLPHAAAERAIEQADLTELYALQSGSQFSIRSNLNGFSPQEQSEITAAVRQKLEQHGWKFAASSPNQVVLELKQGETEENEYRMGGFHTEKAKFRPWTHSIQFLVGGTEVYRFQRIVGGGFMLSVNRGETAQQAVDRQVKPTADIFRNALLPGRILKPEFRQGMGKSEITPTGLK